MEGRYVRPSHDLELSTKDMKRILRHVVDSIVVPSGGEGRSTAAWEVSLRGCMFKTRKIGPARLVRTAAYDALSYGRATLLPSYKCVRNGEAAD